MNFADIPLAELQTLAKTSGIRYRTGPFTVCLKTELSSLVRLMQMMYKTTPLLDDNTICQFHVHMTKAKGLRHWIKPQAVFHIDGLKPFDPFPADHALPLFEWGLNWCIGSAANGYLILHSAVVEKNGKAIILPALPGSGKSTLCAGLIHRGWRLLSDEFGIVDHKTGELLPIPRTIPLKNKSIEVIKAFAPDACIGPTFPKTRKGDVAHVAPPADSVLHQADSALPAFVVFPKFTQNAETTLVTQAKGIAFTRLSNNSFNYQFTMENGFNTLTRLVKNTGCFALSFGDLDSAIAQLDKLVEHSPVVQTEKNAE